MTQNNFVALSYTGTKHTTLVVDKKNNPETVKEAIQATGKDLAAALAKLTGMLPENSKIEIKDVPQSYFSKIDTTRLTKMYEKISDMLGAKEMIQAVLEKRGVKITPALKKAEKPAKKTVKETAPKEERILKKSMSESELQERLAEARKNYKKACRFVCTKDKQEHDGIIRSARLDKRSGFIQYRIEITINGERTGKIYGKADDSADLTIIVEESRS